jgi:hypothetical protein
METKFCQFVCEKTKKPFYLLQKWSSENEVYLNLILTDTVNYWCGNCKFNHFINILEI